MWRHCRMDLGEMFRVISSLRAFNEVAVGVFAFKEESWGSKIRGNVLVFG